MTRLILATLLAALGSGHEAGAARSPADATISPYRPDMYCSERDRTRTIERFEARVATWRSAMARAESQAQSRAAGAYLVRFEQELRLVRAAPVYRCTVRLAR